MHFPHTLPTSHLLSTGQVDPDDLMMVRSDAGLFTLQQCCIVLGHLWATGDAGLRKRVLMLLHQKGQALSSIRCGSAV